MKKLLLILLVGLFLFSCKKKQTIHITAKNAATGEGYAGLTYYVVTYKNSLIPYEGKKSKTVATGSLDENGEAYVTERLSKNNGHSVRVVEPENACYNKNIQFYFSDEKNFKAEFEFAECAYLKLKIENVNCQGSEDTMRFRSKYSFTDWEGWAGERMGCYSYETPYPFEVSEGWRIYEWEVNRNGVITTYLDSIYLNKGVDNGFFQMNY